MGNKTGKVCVYVSLTPTPRRRDGASLLWAPSWAPGRSGPQHPAGLPFLEPRGPPYSARSPRLLTRSHSGGSSCSKTPHSWPCPRPRTRSGEWGLAPQEAPVLALRDGLFHRRHSARPRPLATLTTEQRGAGREGTGRPPLTPPAGTRLSLSQRSVLSHTQRCHHLSPRAQWCSPKPDTVEGVHGAAQGSCFPSASRPVPAAGPLHFSASLSPDAGRRLLAQPCRRAAPDGPGPLHPHRTAEAVARGLAHVSSHLLGTFKRREPVQRWHRVPRAFRAGSLRPPRAPSRSHRPPVRSLIHGTAQRAPRMPRCLCACTSPGPSPLGPAPSTPSMATVPWAFQALPSCHGTPAPHHQSNPCKLWSSSTPVPSPGSGTFFQWLPVSSVRSSSPPALQDHWQFGHHNPLCQLRRQLPATDVHASTSRTSCSRLAGSSPTALPRAEEWPVPLPVQHSLPAQSRAGHGGPREGAHCGTLSRAALGSAAVAPPPASAPAATKAVGQTGGQLRHARSAWKSCARLTLRTSCLHFSTLSCNFLSCSGLRDGSALLLVSRDVANFSSLHAAW